MKNEYLLSHLPIRHWRSMTRHDRVIKCRIPSLRKYESSCMRRKIPVIPIVEKFLILDIYYNRMLIVDNMFSCVCKRCLIDSDICFTDIPRTKQAMEIAAIALYTYKHPWCKDVLGVKHGVQSPPIYKFTHDQNRNVIIAQING